MAPNHLVLFDCDGTLVDGQHMIVAAMQRAFEDRNLPEVASADVRAIIGLSLHEAMAQLLPDADMAFHAVMAEQYKSSFADMRRAGEMQEEPLYEGTIEALKMLDSAGYLLGVATGKSQRGLDRVLSEHEITHMFVTKQTADYHPSKPHPSMAETAMAEAGATPATTIMVGDTSYDMMMGAAAGTHVLGVNWGYHHRGILLESGASHVAESYSLVPALVAKIFEGDGHAG